MKITIIGGGIIGLCSAYYLIETGHEVTIIERGSHDDGCSFGNAGMIVPSHFIPLATPGMISKGIRWMFDAESPFFVRPRLDWGLISWGIKFYNAANDKQVKAAMPALRDIGLLSRSLYNDLAKIKDMNFSFEEKGLMMLCKTQETFEEEAHVAKQANDLGIIAKELSINELHQLEPQIKPTVAGAIYYPNDAHLYPNVFVKQLKNYLEKRGVTILHHTEVTGFEIENSKIIRAKCSTTNLEQIQHSTLNIEQLVVAAGSWSAILAKALNINLPMQGGKGYSVTYEQIHEKKLNIPSILVESRVAITPMGADKIRFGGTMEIAGLNQDINMNRVRGIIKSVPKYFPNYEVEMPKKEEIWAGLRPCSPDGLPYIGRTSKYRNVVIATGHAMMGLSLAPATGKLIQEIIDNKVASVSTNLFDVDRF